MSVRQAQTLVNDNDELNEPQHGQHSDTISPPEICFSIFIYYIYRPFKSCHATGLLRRSGDSGARAERVRTIKESLLSKRDSHKDKSSSNIITRSPIQDMNGAPTPCPENHHSLTARPVDD